MSNGTRHHPDEATLMSYAAGTLPESLSAVVAAHISMCPDCRADVTDMEMMGASLLLGASLAGDKRPLQVPPLPPHVPDQPPAKRRDSALADDRLPSPIARAYGLTLATVPWRRLGPGVWHHRLPLSKSESGDLRLLRISPGLKMPDHGHSGSELTLVIEGVYSDVTGEYRRGDVQDVDEDIEHQPFVSGDSECICIIASERPARFKTLVGRMLQPWTGL